MTADFEGPIAKLVTPLPLELAGAVFKAVAQAAESLGYETFCRQEDGLGVIHARSRTTDSPVTAEPSGGDERP